MFLAEIHPIEGMENHTVTRRDEDFVSIPRFDVEASAGYGSLVNSEEQTGHYCFKRKWIERRGLNIKSLSVISVAGDSMEPDLYEGDLIVIDTAQTMQHDSHIYAVRFSSALFVKRIQRAPGERILLLSKNKDYSDLIVDDQSVADLDNGTFEILVG